VVYFSTAASRRSRGGTWSIIAPPFISAGGATADDIEILRRYPTTELLSHIVAMRTPFIRMLHEFCELLTKLESSVSGNIRFVVLPGDTGNLSVEFGPQLRASIATALNPNWLKGSQGDLYARIAELLRQTKQLCDQIRPRNVDRFTSHGRTLKQLGDRMPGIDGFKYRWVAENVMKRPSLEYHPADANQLRELRESAAQLDALYQRLTTESPIQMPDDTLRAFRAVGDLIRRKSGEATARTSADYPKPPRSGTDADYTWVQRGIDGVREALLAVSDFQKATGSIFDFMSLRLWRQRWRIYELWLLARLARISVSNGAIMSGAGRIEDGQWRLKFTKDSAPVLTFDLAGIRMDLYYQLFQTGVASNDMPDIAFSIRDHGFVVVADPKHGKSYSRKELAEVCERYDHAFQPNLTCVVNYFDASATIEELDGDRRKLLMWGLRPFTEVEKRFDAEINASLKAAWTRFSLPKPTVLVLFDISESTRKLRGAMKSRFADALRTVFPEPSSHSQIAMFGSSVVAQTSLESASAGLVDFDASDDSTNLEGALNWAIDVLAMQAGTQPQLWLFTDGDAEFQFDLTANRIQETGLQIRVYEATGKPSPTPLHLLCQRTGGVYHVFGTEK
jgi:hypothetical protein